MAAFTKKDMEGKRTRKGNWSPDETKYLVQLYKENAVYLRSDFSSPGCTHRGKLDAWDSITNQLHEAYPDSNRTVKECQKRWQTIQSAAKTRIARFNEALTGTGGGPATPDLDELDQLIADILGKQNITFAGVRGKNDLMTFLHEAVEQQPSGTNDDAEEVQELPAEHTLQSESEPVHLEKKRTFEDTVQSEMDIPSRLIPQSSSTFMLLDEEETSHVAKSRKLEIKLLELKIKTEEKRLLAEEKRLLAEEKRIEAFTAQRIYFKQLINDKTSISLPSNVNINHDLL
ncbi:hypothetical protein Pmani_003766 [Petrolisthes manimaculis]|uniref:Regulatory protein zeste n=1 Tax=Petrolisthes manimaculis TaxID=1843537 RepID=A0AAE1QFY0_9EUCA|nr:hypothetical protein Pmani_003766 [Petrolisthes manimaculis]